MRAETATISMCLPVDFPFCLWVFRNFVFLFVALSRAGDAVKWKIDLSHPNGEKFDCWQPEAFRKQSFQMKMENENASTIQQP